MESAPGASGARRDQREQLGEQSPRTWAVLQSSPAFLGRHEQEFALGQPSPARACGGTESFLQLVLRRSRASWELDSSPPQKAFCS